MITLTPVKKLGAGLVLGLSIAGFAMTAGATSAHAANAASSGSTYVTDSHDTFWLVAKKLNIPLQDLLNANPDIAPNNVYGGLTMKLPGAAAIHSLAAVTAATLSASAEPTVTAASGQRLAYSKTISAVASAYTESPAENGGWGAVDYFGNALKLGTIAVDSNVIPLGTKVYVTGYTFNGIPTGMVCTASDIGGAIKGNRIDMFIPSSIGPAVDFGLQNVTLYVLK